MLIGGGGFVPGIVFNETEPDLIYARTDIGGMYRWQAAEQSWVPLLDWVPWEKWGWNGVLSVATDARDPERLYAALGTYTNSWDPNNGAIARSRDRGATWEVTEMPFKIGGNMPGRGMGERLAIDPNDTRILYFGTEAGHGLWRSVDYGASWAKVESFPNPGNYVQDPLDPSDYLTSNQGVVWVVFDPASGSAGSASQNIYVGVADKQNPLYRSIDGGATWQAVPGAPVGYLPHKGVLDPVGGFLYLATSDTGGPYDGEKGEVWKLDLAGGTWTDISPIPASSSDLSFGYSGLTIDRQKPSTLMVASLNSWWPDMILFRSTDAGITWTRIWDWGVYPERTKRYRLDISEVPWLTFGQVPELPEESPKLGWMNESVVIDPHDSDRFLYGTGATIFGSTDLTKWDKGEQITLRPMVRGLEETAVLDLVSPPVGVHLFSSLGDIGGFKHTDLARVPDLMLANPFIGNTTSFDFAEADPTKMARVGRVDLGDGRPMGLSSDGGDTWFAPQTPPGANGGTVALAADGGVILWAPADQAPVYSTNFGGTWTEVEGLPAGAHVESDRIDPLVFYGTSLTAFYRSADGGKTFMQTAEAAPAATRNPRFKALPGHTGHIWLAGFASGVRFSTDGGLTFQALANVTSAINIAFGMAAPGADYPALYLVGTVDGTTGLFRSDDRGVNWARINDDQHQWGNFGEALSGDPRVYGRVYVGTNGRGILVGEPAQ